MVFSLCRDLTSHNVSKILDKNVNRKWFWICPSLGWKRFWKVNIKNEPHSLFGYMKFLLWTKKGLSIKLTFWFPTAESPKTKVKWPLNWKWHLKGFFNNYNFVSENFSIETCMWELSACKVTIFIPWQNQEFSILFFESSRSFCYIDALPPNNHKVYYKEQSDDLLPSLYHGVFCELCCLWLVHASFWL